MKSLLWIAKTEVVQNKWHFIFISLISLLLGISFCYLRQAHQRIASLAIHETWNADLVVLPKGVSLNDFRDELLTGTSSAFLPEAMFDTTMGLAENKFSLTAVLSLTDDKGPRVLTKSNFSQIGIDWLKGRQNILPWQEQTTYSTTEWGYKVISGFFASGTEQMMKNLKDLVDRKTVGQALFIKRQQAHDEKIQSELQAALVSYSSLVFFLSLISMTSLFVWVKVRLQNSFSVFEELGLPRLTQRKILALLLIATCFIPAMLGVALGLSQ
jgi:hypothetical protein